MTRFLLLLSGGLGSTYLAHWMKSKGVQFECLHLLAGATPDTEERRCATATTDYLQVKLHELDLTHLYASLAPKHRASLFAFPEFEHQLSPNTLPLMLGCGQTFAEARGFDRIVIGIGRQQTGAAPEEALDRWDTFLSQWKQPDFPDYERNWFVVAPYRDWGVVMEYENDKLELDMASRSWSCLRNNFKKPCGCCSKCHSRHFLLNERVERDKELLGDFF